jgi:hypothetical protein
MNKLKTYEAIFDEGENGGTYAVSLVKNPAMEDLFFALNEHKEISLKTVNEEKRIIVGLVLRPNKPVYRNQGGEEFNLVFSEKTVEKLAYSFFKNNYHKNSTIEHDINQKIDGVTFVESWVVRDEKMDTSIAFGLTPQKGDWNMIMKVDNDEVWEDYIKTGKVQGFSIDAMLSLKEVNLKSINMSEQAEKGILEMLSDLPNQIRLALFPDKPIQLGSLKSEDEAVMFEFEGEMLTVGGEVWVTAEDGMRVPVPVGEYPLESNLIMIVTEEGKVGELVEKPSEEVVEDAPAEMAQPEEGGKVSNDAKIASEIESAIKSILIKYSEQSEELKELKAQFAEMANQPASKPIKAQVQMSEPKNAKERIFSKINQLK